MKYKEFIDKLLSEKYIIYETDMNDVQLYGKLISGRMRYVALYEDGGKYLVSSYRIQECINRIKTTFSTQDILMVVFTDDVTGVKSELGAIYGYWIYDNTNKRTYIFDDQPQDFEDIERILYEISEDQVFQKVNTRPMPGGIVTRIVIVNYIIIAINILVFIITSRSGPMKSFNHPVAKAGIIAAFIKTKQEYYRMFTSMFVHGSIAHLASNMIVLAGLGDNLERALGQIRYVLVYFGSGLIGSVATYFYYIKNKPYTCCIGASGAIFGVVGALLYIVFRNKGRLEDLSLPRMIIFIILSLGMGFSSPSTCNAAHVGGFLGGILLGAIFYRKGASEK